MPRHILALSAFGLLCVQGACFGSSVLYEENFDVFSGSDSQGIYVDAGSNLGSEWSFYSTNEGRTRIYNWGGSRDGVLVLDDRRGNSTYSLNEAVLTLDLDGKTDVVLDFKHYDAKDEEHPIGNNPFVGHRNKDGVAVSSDNTNWFPLVNFNQSNNTWKSYTASISDLVASVGNSSLLSLTSQFFIKFQQYDNYPHGSDGRKFDNIVLHGLMPPGSGGQSTVPEPATATLFAIGLVGMACYRRRKKSLR